MDPMTALLVGVERLHVSYVPAQYINEGRVALRKVVFSRSLEVSASVAHHTVCLDTLQHTLSRSNFVDRACPAGHYCPTGSVSPVDCVAGTYQNDTATADCDICPDRRYCESTATEALECPAGFYCPEGTEFATEFPCPNGTYSNETSLATASECPLCPPGRSASVFGVSRGA